jgi:ectoine hydroxylase-related dioxygenase (phytanoyl-CoA dioxygenase family)
MSTLEEWGFEIHAGIFDQREIGAVLKELSRADIPRGRAGARNVLKVEAVRSLALDARLMGLAQAALGETAFPFRATLFDKSPQSNWLIVWHQDTALPLCERRNVTGWGPWSVKEDVLCAHAPARALQRVLAIRIHLDDSTELNGPLRVLPGTHTCGVLTDNEIHDLSTRVAPLSCFAGAGSVLAMKPLVVHSSSKVQSNAGPRRVLHVEYASTTDLNDGITLRIC